MKRRRASAWSRGWDAATARRSTVPACAPLLARWVQHLVQRAGIERLASAAAKSLHAAAGRLDGARKTGQLWRPGAVG